MHHVMTSAKRGAKNKKITLEKENACISSCLDTWYTLMARRLIIVSMASYTYVRRTGDMPLYNEQECASDIVVIRPL